MSHRPKHTHCSLDCKKASKEDDVTRATKLLGSYASGQKLVDKRNAKNKKKWGKNKKAGAKSASVSKIICHDLSSSDAESFSSPERSDDSDGEATSASPYIYIYIYIYIYT